VSPPEVTLSFDNGPEPGVTEEVLEVLKRAKVAASFFVLGSKLADPARRRLAEQAHAQGHWIGNHTMTHRRPLGTLAEPGVARTEILDTEALLGALAHPDRLFRPFGRGGELGPHLLNKEALEVLTVEKMTCVLWNAIPRDWADPDGWVGVALAQCLAHPRTLLVLHDLPTGAMRHLGGFIAAVRRHGGTFRQEFPPECVPMRRGEAIAPLAPYVSA
jgi:peptidoglycan/xylan/chitin deacetylase (PgdA/CDA1 family)